MMLLEPVAGTAKTMKPEDVEMMGDQVSEEELMPEDKAFGQFLYVFIVLWWQC